MFDHDGYEPFEPDLTPRSLAAGGWSREPPPAPQRERPQMVAPGEPTPVEQEHVSRRLWERLEYRPIAGAPAGLRGAHAPHESLSGMSADARSMWSHIGQGACLNLHPSPTHGEHDRTPQQQHRALYTPALGEARSDDVEAAQVSRAEALTRPAALQQPSSLGVAAPLSGAGRQGGANTNTYNLGSMADTSATTSA